MVRLRQARANIAPAFLFMIEATSLLVPFDLVSVGLRRIFNKSCVPRYSNTRVKGVLSAIHDIGRDVQHPNRRHPYALPNGAWPFPRFAKPDRGME